MSQLRFNHVFTALMLLGFVSAFIIPPRFTNPARGELQGLFSPISRPTRSLAEFVYSRVHHEMPVDDGSTDAAGHMSRATDTILDENRRLKLTLASMIGELENLRKLDADRRVSGDVQSLCRPALVTGSDSSGIRESLSIGSPSLGALKEGMAVICRDGLVGRISRAGLAAGQVRLITDPGFSMTGQIGQYRSDAEGHFIMQRIEGLQVLVQGVGHGAMVIRNSISKKQVDSLGISENDKILLDDADWPANLHLYWIGRITKIESQQNAPLYADIRVEPVSDLMRLKEVMVLETKN